MQPNNTDLQTKSRDKRHRQIHEDRQKPSNKVTREINGSNQRSNLPHCRSQNRRDDEVIDNVCYTDGCVRVALPVTDPSITQRHPLLTDIRRVARQHQRKTLGSMRDCAQGGNFSKKDFIRVLINVTRSGSFI